MGKLSADAVRLMGEGKNMAIIATVMADGSPQATAVWIDTDGENVIFNTAEGRVKTDNLRRDPRVAVCVLNADNPYEQVTVRGRVVEITAEGADAHIDALAKRYLGADSYPGRQAGERRVIVRIAPD